MDHAPRDPGGASPATPQGKDPGVPSPALPLGPTSAAGHTAVPPRKRKLPLRHHVEGAVEPWSQLPGSQEIEPLDLTGPARSGEAPLADRLTTLSRPQIVD